MERERKEGGVGGEEGKTKEIREDGWMQSISRDVYGFRPRENGRASLVARWMGRWWGRQGGLKGRRKLREYGEKAKGGFRRRGAPKKNEGGGGAGKR